MLLDARTLLGWTVPASAIGTSLRVAATGIGDVAAVEAAIDFQARPLRPPAPVAVRSVTGPDGTIRCSWTRRSRAGWNWIDGTDAPIAEEAERYRVSLTRGTAATTIEVTAPMATIPPDTLAALGGAGAVAATVAQIGTLAPSLPAATIDLS